MHQFNGYTTLLRTTTPNWWRKGRSMPISQLVLRDMTLCECVRKWNRCVFGWCRRLSCAFIRLVTICIHTYRIEFHAGNNKTKCSACDPAAIVWWLTGRAHSSSFASQLWLRRTTHKKTSFRYEHIHLCIRVYVHSIYGRTWNAPAITKVFSPRCLRSSVVVGETAFRSIGWHWQGARENWRTAHHWCLCNGHYVARHWHKEFYECRIWN